MTKPSENSKQTQTPEEQKQRQEDREKGSSEHNQELLDEGIEESFPASDPPSVSHID